MKRRRGKRGKRGDVRKCGGGGRKEGWQKM